MAFLVISSHLNPHEIYMCDGDMVIIGDDLRQTEMILYVSSSVEDARQFAEQCIFAPNTTLVESISNELRFIEHVSFKHQNPLY